MEKAVITKIAADTWQFTEKFLGENVYCYLLVGEEKALLIDTAYGFTDIAGAVKEITSLPLIVVNTHGHFDHVTANYRFGKTYLHEKDRELYNLHTQRAYLEKLFREIVGGGIKATAAVLVMRPKLKRMLGHPVPETIALPECGFFELGGRKVEIIETPGHTQGSISLLDTKNGWLFSGDTCGDEGMLLHFPEATSAGEFHNTILRIRKLVDDGIVTRNYPSHQTSPAPLEKLSFYDQLLTRLERADLTAEEWNNKAVSLGGIRIVINPQRIKMEARP